MIINETLILKVEDLFFQLASYGTGHVFRGQIDSRWRLRSGIERLFPDDYNLPEVGMLNDFEDKILRKFKSNAHLYEPAGLLPDDRSKFGWLALIQHHGAPSRLLDFTTMPFMALYFAIDGVSAYSENHSVIYCISHRDINAISVSAYCEKTRNTPEPVKKELEMDGDRFYLEHIQNKSYGLLWCLEPVKLNLRMRQQGGTFIVCDDMKLRFEEALNSNTIYQNVRIDRLVFPHSIVSDAFILLNKMGITNKQIYPGLDGLSKDIRQELVQYISRGILKASNQK